MCDLSHILQFFSFDILQLFSRVMEIIQRQGMPSMMSTMFDAKKEFAKTDTDGDMQISMDENMKKFNKTDSDSKTTVHNC